MTREVDFKLILMGYDPRLGKTDNEEAVLYYEEKDVMAAMTEACRQILEIAAQDAKIILTNWQGMHPAGEIRVDKDSITSCIKYIKP